jgi:hypothetical protein
MMVAQTNGTAAIAVATADAKKIFENGKRRMLGTPSLENWEGV